MIQVLEQNIAGVTFNGDVKGNSLYTVLNVSLPPNENAEMLIFNLDINGIAASAGSACSSGSETGSRFTCNWYRYVTSFCTIFI